MGLLRDDDATFSSKFLPETDRTASQVTFKPVGEKEVSVSSLLLPLTHALRSRSRWPPGTVEAVVLSPCQAKNIALPPLPLKDITSPYCFAWPQNLYCFMVYAHPLSCNIQNFIFFSCSLEISLTALAL